MAEQTHTVQRGETIHEIATQYKFRTWHPIWEHPNNAEIKKLRVSPHVLAMGDKLFIPEIVPKDHGVPTNKKHTFKVRTHPKTKHFEQAILDHNDEPLAGKQFELTAAGETITGNSDGNGLVQADIPIDTKTVSLKIWIVDGDDSQAVTWDLRIGDLEPVDTIYGLKGHLKNLGYECGEIDDNFDEKTVEAIKHFQRDQGLSITGESDKATQDRLVEMHAYS